MSDRTYIAIDLKSFYASVECMDRNLDPMTTNLVVADESRTEKTICLAVSPALKAHGIPGRARLFEVIQRVRAVNDDRRHRAPRGQFTGKSANAPELQFNPALELDYVVAIPRMARYMEVSAKIYSVYLKYVSPDDIHVYSIDEVFIDATSYLKLYKLTAREFAMKIIRDVLQTTGITATAGIGPNMYLCKIAMDIEAKHIQANKDGVRIAELTERSYREKMWSHRPLTDFWRVGKGYASKLEAAGMYTMGDVARMSVKNEDLLYRMFGINAELLIDHAWGWEPCTIADIKSYRPENSSVSSGQVLQDPYEHDKAKLVVREMTDILALDLVEKRIVTDQLTLNIAYDVLNLPDPELLAEGDDQTPKVCRRRHFDDELLSRLRALRRRSIHTSGRDADAGQGELGDHRRSRRSRRGVLLFRHELHLCRDLQRPAQEQHRRNGDERLQRLQRHLRQ